MNALSSVDLYVPPSHTYLTSQWIDANIMPYPEAAEVVTPEIIKEIHDFSEDLNIHSAKLITCIREGLKVLIDVHKIENQMLRPYLGEYGPEGDDGRAQQLGQRMSEFEEVLTEVQRLTREGAVFFHRESKPMEHRPTPLVRTCVDEDEDGDESMREENAQMRFG
jgi:hypothetical protein